MKEITFGTVTVERDTDARAEQVFAASPHLIIYTETVSGGGTSLARLSSLNAGERCEEQATSGRARRRSVPNACRPPTRRSLGRSI